MFRLFCFAIGYAAGCFQTAYYVGRIFGKIDIREHGSGNAGTTNITRTLGAKAGILTFLTDILKTILVYVGCSMLFNGSGSFYTYAGEGNGLLPGLYAGMGVVMGHVFPVQLKFKGGKGAAATLAVFLCIHLKTALISFAMGVGVVISTQFISAAALVSTISFDVFACIDSFFQFSFEDKIICSILALIVIVKHRENIQRLLTGNERKFSVKKK